MREITRRFSPSLAGTALAGCVWVVPLMATVASQPFLFPTANQALYEPNGDARFLAPTPGHTWESGSFGCVRTDRSGVRLHEGLDIRSVATGRNGEPTDAVLASAGGTVAYINRRPGSSNYGNYIIVRHYLERLEVYSLYAHLSAIQPGLVVGSQVGARDRIATMGRTGQPIGKDRAHVHFEINLVLSERFKDWFGIHYPGERNDHGNFNGRNLLGLDPRAILLTERSDGAHFSLTDYIKSQPVMAQVVVRRTEFSFVRRYPQLLRPNLRAEHEGVAGFELGLNFNGIPVQITPRSARELGAGPALRLLSVNETEWHKHPCARLVVKRGQTWTLTGKGDELVSLLTF